MALVLPTYVAFKGDNGMYLSARWIEGYPYLMFAASDVSDSTVGHEIHPNGDGSIRIRSFYLGKFWRRSPNWIWADSDDTTSYNPDTVFWPVKIGDNIIALRNYGNNNFCKRLTAEGKESCLNAGVENITLEAHLVVEEPVLSRTISNVIYRNLEVKYYNEEVIEVGRAEAFNYNTKGTSTEQLTFAYAETSTSTWNNTISVKLGVKTTLKAGVPFVVKGRVEISAEVSNAFQWGETKTETKTMTNAYTVTVSASSVATVVMTAKNGSYSIPFSYTQTDQLLDGSFKTYFKDDGVYVGRSALDFLTENSERSL